MERKIKFAADEFYHVYNRGVEKRDIFMDLRDKLRFQRLLYFANSSKPLDFKQIQGLPLDTAERGETLVNIGAYCLMPNHFHLLIHEKKDGGLSKFMMKLTTAYSMYFNKKTNRSGRLFQNIFQARHIETDEHLNYLFAYIHLNPIKLADRRWPHTDLAKISGFEPFLNNYSFSSYPDYRHETKRPEAAILAPQAFPEYFSTKREFGAFIQDWLRIQILTKI